MSEQPMSDNSFTRNFIIMIIAMCILTAILMVLASFNASDVNENLKAEKDAEKLPAIVEQIAPIGTVAVGSANTVAAEEQAPEILDGETVYNGACLACHGNRQRRRHTLCQCNKRHWRNASQRWSSRTE